MLSASRQPKDLSLGSWTSGVLPISIKCWRDSTRSTSYAFYSGCSPARERIQPKQIS